MLLRPLALSSVAFTQNTDENKQEEDNVDELVIFPLDVGDSDVIRVEHKTGNNEH